MTDEFKTPHVAEALLKILESLSVEKGGVLPGNMGGKSYITAVDAAQEVKRKFVEHGLVFIPSETVVQTNYIDFNEHNKRLHVAIVIEGRYTFISTRDGSQVTVGGVGDGLAIGTAVASNIASTNAMKNALLRTFLITEQSVEEQAKKGVDDAAPDAPGQSTPSRATRAVDAGKGRAPKVTASLDEARNAVKAAWAEVHSDEDDYSPTGYMALGSKTLKQGWADRVNDLKSLEKAIRGGEVA